MKQNNFLGCVSSMELPMEPNHLPSLEGFVHLVRWTDKQAPASKISLFYFTPFSHFSLLFTFFCCQMQEFIPLF